MVGRTGALRGHSSSFAGVHSFATTMRVSIHCCKRQTLHHDATSGFKLIRFQSTLVFPGASSHQNQTLSHSELFLKHQRPPTPWRRFLDFPTNTFQLLRDYWRYRNILDAARTKRNAWTRQSHVLRSMYNDDDVTLGSDSPSGLPQNPNLLKWEGDASAARIPRRQYQQLLQFHEDFYTVLPTILLTTPPIIGYLPLIAAMIAPRQVLSRQFHNEYEILTFSQLAYRQREENFQRFGSCPAWIECVSVAKRKLTHCATLTEDAAGPVFNLWIIFEALFQKENTSTSRGKSNLALHLTIFSFNQMPRDHLTNLALANGQFQKYPSWVGRYLADWSSHSWLQRRLLGIAAATRLDDSKLLEEAHDNDGCQSLSDIEVLDASLMRGLPVSTSFDEMRECLTNYLLMMREWNSRRTESSQPEAEELFLLHLSALRYLLKQQLTDVHFRGLE